MKILDIQHELLYDHDTLCIVIDKSDRSRLQEYLSTINLQKGKEYDVSIKRHYENRHLTQNSYYRLLLHKMLSVLGTKNRDINVLHNEQLNKYGVPLLDGEGNITYCLYKASIDFMKSEDIHLKPTGRTENRNGTLYAWYMMMKPSHLMTTKEMSDLLDGTISDAKELGIQTETPDEIARMKAIGAE